MKTPKSPQFFKHNRMMSLLHWLGTLLLITGFLMMMGSCQSLDLSASQMRFLATPTPVLFVKSEVQAEETRDEPEKDTTEFWYREAYHTDFY